jgi:hypothetical protein
MANKDLFKQAIAEAKSIRETAIANAKEALEESLTPHLKDMLAAKLQEMDDSKNEEVENVNEEEVEEAMHADKKDEAMHGKKKDESIEESEEISEEETIEEAPKDKEVEEAHGDDVEEIAADDANEAEGDSEESEDEAKGDEELGDLTVDQFKDIIRDVIAQEMEPAGDAIEEPADMDAGDLDAPADDAEIEDGEGDEEIDLDELIRELENVSEEEVNEAPKEDEVDEAMHGDKKKDEAMHGKKKDEGKKEEMDEEVKEEVEEEVVNEAKEEEKSDLDQALETIESLKKDLNEVNLLNAKLLYVNKIFKSNDLNESQKVNIISAFDKAETVKEVKLVYETVSENVVAKKEKATIKESKLGMASKATGTTASKPEVINEVSDTVRRMQKLAGII